MVFGVGLLEDAGGCAGGIEREEEMDDLVFDSLSLVEIGAGGSASHLKGRVVDQNGDYS